MRQMSSNQKDLMKDVTLAMFIGYNCMPPVPDRNMGLWQGVYVDFTGAVDIRSPLVITDLPLPDTSQAFLIMSAELVNASTTRQNGTLRGEIVEAGLRFEKRVE